MVAVAAVLLNYPDKTANDCLLDCEGKPKIDNNNGTRLLCCNSMCKIFAGENGHHRLHALRGTSLKQQQQQGQWQQWQTQQHQQRDANNKDDDVLLVLRGPPTSIGVVLDQGPLQGGQDRCACVTQGASYWTRVGGL